MRKKLGVAVLLLAICFTAFAGEIPNPPITQPQGPTTVEPTPDPTDTAAAPANTEEDTALTMDTLTQTVLNVLASLLF